jgi:hypothetical protein
MLDKIDYSDIYKFLSSIGLVLIITAVLIPIFIFQFDVVKDYRGINLQIISDIAKQSIQYQEKLVFWLIKLWWILSSACLLSGLLIFGYGIKKWSSRQKVRDKIESLGVLEKEKMLNPASQNEVEKKRKEDADEIEEDGSNDPVILQSYKTIEDNVINSLTIKDQNIQIRSHLRLNNYIYDLVIIYKLLNQKRLHKVCEIKYYQKEIFYTYVLSGISSFLLSILNYNKYIAFGERRIKVEYYMIWICATQEQKGRLELYRDKAMVYSKERGIDLTIILKTDTELNSIKDELV